jgi:predicted TPR repeat methyltransferase
LKCRHCGFKLTLSFLDLGAAPPSNSYLRKDQLAAPEVWFPLRVLVCEKCWLAQTEDYVGREALFTENYAYFSSVSDSWLIHAEHYVKEMTERFELSAASMVVEVGANDGYLMQYIQEREIPCYGIEPTRSTAKAARVKGIEVIEEFFGMSLARGLVQQGRAADLIVANNVLAHVPDINDFVSGFAHLLKPKGVATFEFPHLLRMVEQAQFDTVYHEHYSYLSLSAVTRIFVSSGLHIFDVQEVETHGGSLRVFAQSIDTKLHMVCPSVDKILAMEQAAGIETAPFYSGFQAVAERVKNDLFFFLIDAKQRDKRVAAYGAAAKGNTLLNFAGVKKDLLEFVCDAALSKQGMYLPGSRIPILPVTALAEKQPDFVVIFPWNISQEIMDQVGYIRDWGGEFVTVVPKLVIH